MNIKQVPAAPTNYSIRKTKKVGIVFHWMVGEIAACDATFQNPNRKASAQYGIGSNGEIHQYVKDENVAFHCGSDAGNVKWIGIEHAGGQLINGVRKTPTEACIQASIELCKMLCQKHGFKLVRGQTAFKHSEVSPAPTMCCGYLDIDRIVNSANNTPMAQFNYELYKKDNNLYMRVLSDSIKENVKVEDATTGKVYPPIFCNKSAGNDGGALLNGLDPNLYRVTARGVVKEYDNRPVVVPVDPRDQKIKDLENNIQKKQAMIDSLTNANNDLLADNGRLLQSERASKIAIEALKKQLAEQQTSIIQALVNFILSLFRRK